MQPKTSRDISIFELHFYPYVFSVRGLICSSQKRLKQLSAFRSHKSAKHAALGLTTCCHFRERFARVTLCNGAEDSP